MRRRTNPFSRVLHSATPALASVIAASAYGLGAIVFSIASTAPAETLPDRGLLYQAPSLIPARADGSNGELPSLMEPARVETALEFQPPQAVPAAPVAATPPQTPAIAIIIDDIGLDLAAAERTAALPGSLTLAILPYARNAQETALMAQSAGHDVIVHMPMEPLGLADPGPNALRLSLSDADIQARIRWALARVPGATGINNHMGSRFTQDPGAMRVALEAASDQVPIFLDSMTTGESRGAAVARGLGLTALERDIFLDHVIDAATIAARLEDAERLADLRGWAIVIGHPHEQTLNALEAWMPAVQSRGVRLISLTQLVDELNALPAPERIEASMIE